jgi:chromosome segregation ATPase
MLMLKRIELSGFKSFAKKTVLDFDTPVTAIVGPNGSGKSNVVEAIRFVLGEQSIKSLRGKGGADLIFKGSKALTALSRASVTIVFDNSRKVFSLPRTGDKMLNLDFDEISISREVYSDGSNTYKLNGTEVRLKDILELVASVNIGSSGHHIISQGEADRLLSANAKDRRGMIEDALGLRIYQYRLRESERKLDKTLSNMKEVQSLRREIAPHMSFLKKQVEKIEKAQELRIELGGLYKEYFAKQSGYISKQKSTQEAKTTTLEQRIREAQQDIVTHESNRENTASETGSEAEVARLQLEYSKHTTSQGELTRKLGRVEGSISLLEQQLAQPEKELAPEDIAVSLQEIEGLFGEIEKELVGISTETDLTNIQQTVARVREMYSQFIYYRRTDKNQSPVVDHSHIEVQLQGLRDTCQSVENEIAEIDRAKVLLQEKIMQLQSEKKSDQTLIREQERAYYELKAKKQELESELRMVALERENLTRIEAEFEDELKQASILIGLEAIRFEPATELADKMQQEELKRKIDRIKYKLEDAGAQGGSEVLKEYEETVTRDEFLARELTDIDQAVIELRALIRELKEKIDTEFKVGVEKINQEFTKFFSLMFGGGHAFLSIVVEHKRPSKGDEEDEIPVAESTDFEFERGIEINVSLPHKKVKDLHMLSGGERSLTSIALLFAMSQVNPPPFLVLDETDAALDEANSRRYGDMIENLSEYSQLIVVTHNRETMSRARVLYGVTIGADGGSKLLSIKLEEAVKNAK